MRTGTYTSTLSFSSILLMVVLATGAASAQTADEIVKKMDENMTFNTRTGNATLEVVRAGQGTDTRTLRLWAAASTTATASFCRPRVIRA